MDKARHVADLWQFAPCFLDDGSVLQAWIKTSPRSESYIHPDPKVLKFVLNVDDIVERPCIEVCSPAGLIGLVMSWETCTETCLKFPVWASISRVSRTTIF